jgi:hypothetical protein
VLPLLLVACASGEAVCPDPAPVVDWSETLGEGDVAVLQSFRDDFDARSRDPQCAELVVWSYPTFVNRRNGTTIARHSRSDSRSDVAPDVRARLTLCEGALREHRLRPAEDPDHDAVFGGPFSTTDLELLRARGADPSDRLTETEAAWVYTCAMGPRSDLPLRQVLHDRCGATVWSEGWQTAHDAFWRADLPEVTVANALLGAETAVPAATSWSLLTSLDPLVLIEADDETGRERVWVDGVLETFDRPLLDQARVTVGGVFDDQIVLSTGTEIGDIDVWALDRTTGDLRHLDRSPLALRFLVGRDGLAAYWSLGATQGSRFFDGDTLQAESIELGSVPTGAPRDWRVRSSAFWFADPTTNRSLSTQVGPQEVYGAGWIAVAGDDSVWTAFAIDGDLFLGRNDGSDHRLGVRCGFEGTDVRLLPVGDAMHLAWRLGTDWFHAPVEVSP